VEKLIKCCTIGNVNCVKNALKTCKVTEDLISDVTSVIIQNYSYDILKVFIEDGRFYFHDSLLHILAMFKKFDAFEYVYNMCVIKYANYNVTRIIYLLMESDRDDLVYMLLNDDKVNSVLEYNELVWLMQEACSLGKRNIIDILLGYDALVLKLDVDIFDLEYDYVIDKLTSRFKCTVDELKVILNVM